MKPIFKSLLKNLNILFKVTPSLNVNIPIQIKFNIYLINTKSRSISLMHRKLLPKVTEIYIFKVQSLCLFQPFN